jgi:hypothetical protein
MLLGRRQVGAPAEGFQLDVAASGRLEQSPSATQQHRDEVQFDLGVYLSVAPRHPVVEPVEQPPTVAAELLDR